MHDHSALVLGDKPYVAVGDHVACLSFSGYRLDYATGEERDN